jgi:hypothetical protein
MAVARQSLTQPRLRQERRRPQRSGVQLGTREPTLKAACIRGGVDKIEKVWPPATLSALPGGPYGQVPPILVEATHHLRFRRSWIILWLSAAYRHRFIRASAMQSKCYATIRGKLGAKHLGEIGASPVDWSHTGTAVVSKLFSEPCTSCMRVSRSEARLNWHRCLQMASRLWFTDKRGFRLG